MKTIALFGATGKAGRILLPKLLEQGYNVKALVRSPSKVSLYHPNLHIIKGDVLNEPDVLKTLELCDAVINVIGHVKNCPPDLQTRAIETLLSGMSRKNITRIIDLTGGGVKIQGDDPGLIDRSMVYIMKNLLGESLRNRFTDGENHVKLLAGSNTAWTVVRAPVLLSGKPKGKTRIGFVGHIPGYSLTFEDLTDQIVKILQENTYIKEYPYITNG